MPYISRVYSVSAIWPYLLLSILCVSQTRHLIANAFIPSSINAVNAIHSRSKRIHRCRSNLKSSSNQIPSWKDIQSTLEPSFSDPNKPISIDSALDPSKPNYSSTKPTLFRERHGWCPYSERVWLTLEVKNISYDTIRIDNTGPGRKPSYFRGGLTPQMKWQDGKDQGESMDLVRALDDKYNNDHGPVLYPPDIENDVIEKTNAFSRIFPKGARPSSRAAFLFRWDGEPLWKSEFEKVLEDTNGLLGETASLGPFFCGDVFTAADVAWAPFLERYGAQLPCFHDGLNPRTDYEKYPHLVDWYNAMDQLVPAYACRVKGDSSSWRKVLSMAGYGNGGVPPDVSNRMEDMALGEGNPVMTVEEQAKEESVWKEYAATRPWVGRTAGCEAANVMLRNRAGIVADVLKRASTSGSAKGLPLEENDLDVAMRAMVCVLSDGFSEQTESCKEVPGVGALASFLDDRMCVPRDMGSMSASCIKRLAAELS